MKRSNERARVTERVRRERAFPLLLRCSVTGVDLLLAARGEASVAEVVAALVSGAAGSAASERRAEGRVARTGVLFAERRAITARAAALERQYSRDQNKQNRNRPHVRIVDGRSTLQSSRSHTCVQRSSAELERCAVQRSYTFSKRAAAGHLESREPSNARLAPMWR